MNRRPFDSADGAPKDMNKALEPRRVADVMTVDAKAVAPSTPFKTIVATMKANRVSGLPVVDASGEVVGLVSEADLLLKEERQDLAKHEWLEGKQRRNDRRKSEAATALDVMSSPALTISSHATVTEAARRMHELGVKRLIVVNEDGRLSGIVSRGDLIKVFLRPDREIETTVRSDLIEQTLWLESGPIDIHVNAGIVTLTGSVPRRSDRKLIGAMTERLDGVVAVRNALEYEWDDEREAKRGYAMPLMVRSGS
jgi:CBS domain-containing protein